MSVDNKQAHEYKTLDDPVCDLCGGNGTLTHPVRTCEKCGGDGRVKAEVQSESPRETRRGWKGRGEEAP